ncbi:MAG: HAMP domain-containing protein, partial [Rhodospirillaceae bacterium]|nr:HAMP domain-containing protein [Rhodospirillaceae bacterium]
MGLFWRIFFSFWAAMLLLLGVMAYSAYVVVNAWNQQSQLSYTELVGRADAVLKAGGEERLSSWLRNPSNFPPDLTLFVFDPQGAEILDRPIPPPVETTLNTADPASRLPRYRVRQLVSGEGVEYSAVLGPNPPPILGALGTPLMRWTVIVAAFVISPLVCFVLSRSLTDPLRRVVAATRRLAAGDLATRVEVGARGRDDEVGELGRQFDRMAARLEQLITTRTELFRNVSHELRTPLARIRIATELARRKPGELDDQLGRIERETDHLDLLTRHVLSLAHLEESPADADLLEIDLVELVEGVAQDASYEAEAQGKKVVWEAGDKGPVVRANADLLHSAVENVVRNALRHTPLGTQVEISLK